MLRDRRGSVALLGFVAMTAVLGMAGFTVDLGAAYVQQARLQKVADSAAMAGAVSWVKTGSSTAATATIKAVVLANGYPATVIQAKAPILAQSPRNSAYAAVQVGLTAPSPLTFLRAVTAAGSVTTTVYAVVEVGPPSTPSIPTLFSTGVNAQGAALASGARGDPHYTLTSVPLLASTTVQIGASDSQSGTWPTLKPVSAWIMPLGGQGIVPTGSYTYQTTFDLTGFNPATVVISGQVMADDQVTIQVNGAAAVSTSADYNTAVAFKLNTGFTDGVNVLRFYVGNTGGPTGLRVAMTGTASPKLALVQ